MSGFASDRRLLGRILIASMKRIAENDARELGERLERQGYFR